MNLDIVKDPTGGDENPRAIGDEEILVRQGTEAGEYRKRGSEQFAAVAPACAHRGIRFLGQRYQAIVFPAGETTFAIVATPPKPTDRDESAGVLYREVVAGSQIRVVCHSRGRRPPNTLVWLQARYNHCDNPHPKNDWQGTGLLATVNLNRPQKSRRSRFKCPR